MASPLEEKLRSRTENVTMALHRVLDEPPANGNGNGDGGHTTTNADDDDRARREAFLETRRAAWVQFRDVVMQYAIEPPWSEDSLIKEVLHQTLELDRRIDADHTGRDPDWAIRDVVLHIEDVLHSLQREVEHEKLDVPIDAARFVIDELGEIEPQLVAELLGVEDRTVRTWKRGTNATIRKNPDRVVLVAQIVYDLRRAMSPRGVTLWFRRSRPQLGDRAPLDLLEDPVENEEQLRSLARAARGQLAT